MSKTSENINRILADIEGTPNPFSTVTPLTTEQVVHILLGNENDSLVNEKNSDLSGENYTFDMSELKKWKEQNNYLYKINYYRNFPPDTRKSIKLINFVKKIIRKLVRFLIDPICKDQTDFNASITASINALFNNELVTQSFIKSQIDNMNSIEFFKARIEQLSQELNKFQEIISEQEKREIDRDLSTQELKDGLSGELENLKNTLRNEITIEHKNMECTTLHELENQRMDFAQLLNNLQNKYSNDLNYLEGLIHSTEINFLKAIHEEGINLGVKTNIFSKHEHNSLLNEMSYINDSNTYETIDYFDFENHFRGSQREIKKNQRIYVPYFKNSGLIVDLGCGRGEFLELLAEQNIPAIGIDLYEEFVEYCTIKGLNAVHDDGLHYLKALKDETIGGIFAAQLVEHLKIDDIISLCTLSFLKLKPGSCLILETPNPTSLSIYTNAFYIDPSHVKPVHPKMLKYFLEKAGFQDIEIIFTESSKIDYKLPLINGNGIENLEEFNNGVNLLSDLIFGSQDYAIIARK